MVDENKWINKYGYLYKMGFERPSWKKRWFVLEKNIVQYYADQGDWKKKKPPKGEFVMDFLSQSKIKTVETGTVLVNSNALLDRSQRVTLKRNYLLQIGDCRWNEAGVRTFFVSCETEEERKTWLTALLVNCELYVNSPQGQEEEAKQPPEGSERREAYIAYLEEKKKAEEKKKQEQVAAEKAQKSKAMRDEPWYQVHNLCSKGSVETLKEGVAAGADVHLLNPNGGSTLLQAATYGNVPIMNYLIEQKLDINAQSNGGNTALHAAACMGFYDAAKLLLERGADRTIKNKEGKTAAQAAKTPSIRDLIEHWGEGGEAATGE
jgi:hypothetical protein